MSTLIRDSFWGFDIEVYPNIFTCYFINAVTGQEAYYEISDRIDQSQQLLEVLKWLSTSGCYMVGFNNDGYDYPVLHEFMLNPNIGYAGIYAKSDSMISGPYNPFGHKIWDNDKFIRQIDLYMIHHFDNANRRTSLKQIEFARRSEEVGDLPYHPGTMLNNHQKDELIKYNRKDVIETIGFLNESWEELEFRAEMTEKMGFSFMNFNDTKLGKQYFIAELEKRHPGICYDKSSGKREPRQTIRPVIDLAECIPDYVRFSTPEFDRMLRFFKSQKITKTKGVFDEATCVVDGLEYKFGTGGLHASVSNTYFVADDYWAILDADFASWYPKLAISHGLFPEHLGAEFCVIYEEFYQMRTQFKKGTTLNKALKLGLNGVYGDSNSKYSPFFDSKYTMSITLAGQLILCLLIEKLSVIPQFKMIQANTDGITMILPRHHLEWCKQLSDEFSKFVNIELEYAEYSRMWVRDVNNYVAEYDGGGQKRIGKYEHIFAENGGRLGWHQDRSAVVVSRAATEYLTKGTKIETTIKGCLDPYDFMIFVKVGSKDKLLNQDGREYQRRCRFYAGINGDFIHKLSPPTGVYGTWKKSPKARKEDYERHIETHKNEAMADVNSDYDSQGVPYNEALHTKNRSKHEIRETAIKKGWPMTECNDMRTFDRSNLNYDYYITKARDLVDEMRMHVNGTN